MKLSSKPISSPGRSDKFPPPLMRFLRSNVGSRSRGRSRASPMFLRKALRSSGSSAAAAAEQAQEPSSPKVTCMGQVRVGRSKKRSQPQKPGRAADDDDHCPGSRCRCAWMCRSLLCHHHRQGRRWRWRRRRSSSRGDLRRLSLTGVWRDCSALFHAAGRRRRRPKISEEEPLTPRSKVETEPRFRNEIVNGELGEGDDSELKSEEEDEKSEVAGARAYLASSSPCSPPKNALLLTRCRSAPYRSSSLACRFWGSPLNGSVGEAQTPQQKGGEESPAEEPRPLLCPEAAESRVHPEQEEEEATADDDDEEERFLKKEIAVLVAEKMVKPAKTGESKPNEEEEGPRPPPRLTRCKSEPARTAAQKVGFG